MRTTLQLDVDVLDAARFLARRRRLSVAAVISDLARQALPLLPIKPSGSVVDLNLVNEQRDEER